MNKSTPDVDDLERNPESVRFLPESADSSPASKPLGILPGSDSSCLPAIQQNETKHAADEGESGSAIVASTRCCRRRRHRPWRVRGVCGPGPPPPGRLLSGTAIVACALLAHFLTCGVSFSIGEQSLFGLS